MQCYKIFIFVHFCIISKKKNPIQENVIHIHMLFLWLNIKMDSIWTKHNVRFKV